MPKLLLSDWKQIDIALSIAKQYGCEVIIGDATAWARERDGLGADCIIDAAGVSATLKIAMDLVRPKGHDHQSRMGTSAAWDFPLIPSFKKMLRFREALVTIGRYGNG